MERAPPKMRILNRLQAKRQAKRNAAIITVLFQANETSTPTDNTMMKNKTWVVHDSRGNNNSASMTMSQTISYGNNDNRVKNSRKLLRRQSQFTHSSGHASAHLPIDSLSPMRTRPSLSRHNQTAAVPGKLTACRVRIPTTERNASSSKRSQGFGTATNLISDRQLNSERALAVPGMASSLNSEDPTSAQTLQIASRSTLRSRGERLKLNLQSSAKVAHCIAGDTQGAPVQSISKALKESTQRRPRLHSAKQPRQLGSRRVDNIKSRIAWQAQYEHQSQNMMAATTSELVNQNSQRLTGRSADGHSARKPMNQFHGRYMSHSIHTTVPCLPEQRQYSQTQIQEGLSKIKQSQPGEESGEVLAVGAYAAQMIHTNKTNNNNNEEQTKPPTFSQRIIESLCAPQKVQLKKKRRPQSPQERLSSSTEQMKQWRRKKEKFLASSPELQETQVNIRLHSSDNGSYSQFRGQRQNSAPTNQNGITLQSKPQAASSTSGSSLPSSGGQGSSSQRVNAKQFVDGQPYALKAPGRGHSQANSYLRPSSIQRRLDISKQKDPKELSEAFSRQQQRYERNMTSHPRHDRPMTSHPDPQTRPTLSPRSPNSDIDNNSGRNNLEGLALGRSCLIGSTINQYTINQCCQNHKRRCSCSSGHQNARRQNKGTTQSGLTNPRQQGPTSLSTNHGKVQQNRPQNLAAKTSRAPDSSRLHHIKLKKPNIVRPQTGTQATRDQLHEPKLCCTDRRNQQELTEQSPSGIGNSLALTQRVRREAQRTQKNNCQKRQSTQVEQQSSMSSSDDDSIEASRTTKTTQMKPQLQNTPGISGKLKNTIFRIKRKTQPVPTISIGDFANSQQEQIITKPEKTVIEPMPEMEEN